MSTPLRPSIVPQCMSCAQRLTKLGLQEWRPSMQQQVRGKKKMVNAGSTVTVRLLKDVTSFGRKGAYVPISVGQMRNVWFPQRVAEYVPTLTLKELSTKNITIERDVEFGAPKPDTATKTTTPDASAQMAAQLRASSRAAQRQVQDNRVTPARATELIEILVPARLDFHRQAIVAEPATPEPTPAVAAPQKDHNSRRNTQRSVSSAAADLLAARSAAPAAPPATPKPVASTAGTPIYGSVSTADVSSAIKAALAPNEEASKISFGDEDVRFVSPAGVEGDKVKMLGEFEVEVRIKGSEGTVRKVVRVLPLEKAE